MHPDLRAKAGANLVTSQVKLVPHLNQPSLLSPATWQRVAGTTVRKHTTYRLCTSPCDVLVLSRGLNKTEGMHEPLHVSARA